MKLISGVDIIFGVLLLLFCCQTISSAVPSMPTDNNVHPNKEPTNVLQILSKDALNRGETKDKDLKTDATITHNSDPAPEFYRGVSGTDSLRDRVFDGQRYGSGGSGNWLTLDRDSLYRNPYIANAVNKLTGSTATPSVSSLMSPNASYRARLDYYNHPSSNDYMNSKYGSSNYGVNGAPYGPPQATDYTSSGYTGQSISQDGIYSNRYSDRYGYGSGYGNSDGFGSGNGIGLGYGGGYGYGGGGHRPYFDKENLFNSKFGKSALLPLAGAALLGVAATLVANPLLLNFAGVGKRKRRSIDNSRRKFDGQELVYRGYNP